MEEVNPLAGDLDEPVGQRGKVRMKLASYIEKLVGKKLNEYGQLLPDPTPIAPPIGYKKQPSMVEHIRAMVRSERLAQEMAASGNETFEESEDFDIEDDPFPSSGYENEPWFEPSEAQELRRGEAFASRIEQEAFFQEQVAGARKRMREATTEAPAGRGGSNQRAAPAAGARSAPVDDGEPE